MERKMPSSKHVAKSEGRVEKHEAHTESGNLDNAWKAVSVFGHGVSCHFSHFYGKIY